MPRAPQLNALQYFEAAARHLNFRMAAEELSITQGAVAQQVRGIEKQLDVKLFERLPRGLSLTEEGRLYFISIQRALNLVKEATDNLRPEKQILNISTTPSFASKWLVPRLQNFTDCHPDIDVRISASEGFANFYNDKIDIAIRHGKPPFGKALEAEMVYPIKIIAVCSPQHFSSDENPITLENLSNQILLHDGHGHWPIFFETAGLTGEDGRVRILKFNQTSLAIDAAMNDQGIALAPIPFVEADIEAGRLYSPFDTFIDTDIGFYAVSPVAPRNPNLVKKMKDWLNVQTKMA